MSLIDRFMRVIVFFDLPTLTTDDIKRYNKFVKTIIRNGYIRTQLSIYSKMVVNNRMGELEIAWLRKNAPKQGNIQVLSITEKQYASIEYIVGKKQTKIIENTEKLVIL